MPKVGFISPVLQEFWKSQPAPGLDRTPLACVKRLRKLLEAFGEQIDMNQALEDHVWQGLEDCDELEKVLCP